MISGSGSEEFPFFATTYINAPTVLFSKRESNGFRSLGVLAH